MFIFVLIHLREYFIFAFTFVKSNEKRITRIELFIVFILFFLVVILLSLSTSIAWLKVRGKTATTTKNWFFFLLPLLLSFSCARFFFSIWALAEVVIRRKTVIRYRIRNKAILILSGIRWRKHHQVLFTIEVGNEGKQEIKNIYIYIFSLLGIKKKKKLLTIGSSLKSENCKSVRKLKKEGGEWWIFNANSKILKMHFL